VDNPGFATENRHFFMRLATVEEVPFIFQFLKELADYEKMLDEIVATEELRWEWFFEKEKAEVLIGELAGEPVGCALFFYDFAALLGCPGIFLEYLYIKPSMRNKGLGKMMLRQLAKLALARDCGRLEWWCLHWDRPKISFYLSLGAKPLRDWTAYRLAGEALDLLANGTSKSDR